MMQTTYTNYVLCETENSRDFLTIKKSLIENFNAVFSEDGNFLDAEFNSLYLFTRDNFQTLLKSLLCPTLLSFKILSFSLDKNEVSFIYFKDGRLKCK